MLIKKQVTYLTELCSAVWIAKVDFLDGQSMFNYGFIVENEQEEQISKEKATITLALRDISAGDVIVIGKKTVLDTTNLTWFVVEDQNSFRPISQDAAPNEYYNAINQREQESDGQTFRLAHISTEHLKRELMRREQRLAKDRYRQKASNTKTVEHVGFKKVINKNNYNDSYKPTQKDYEDLSKDWT